MSSSSDTDDDSATFKRLKRKTHRRQKKLPQSSNDCSDETKDAKSCFSPSSLERSIHHVNPDRLSYEVISRGIQTDWSWLRDGKVQDQDNENSIQESIDLSEVKEKLELGLYGGFGVFNRGLEYESKQTDNAGETDKTTVHLMTVESNRPKKKESAKQQGVKKDLTSEATEETSHVKSISNKNEKIPVIVQKARPKSASSKTTLAEADSDSSEDGTKSCSSLMNVKPVIPNIKAGPPEIIKYHRQKSATGERRASQKHPELELPLAAAPVPSGLFSGICQFCGKEIVEKSGDSDTSPDQNYCCPEYEHFLQLNNDNEDDGEIEDELIDISPHTNFQSSKVSRKTANREKTSERVRERELERQRAATQQANLFSFAKQMKTIQYSLASTKYMDEGWTIKPKSPIPIEPEESEDLFQIDFNTTLIQKSSVLQQRYYENGRTFLTIYPDGTGCFFYPSGHLAMSIISIEEGKYTYIIQQNSSFDPADEDVPKNSGLLALFEPNGVGMCYYENNGKLRLFVNAHGGIELDRKGGKRKRWQWYFMKGHVHTPPFQPICFPLNKYISIRLVDQHNIALIFSASKQTIRLNVAANLKPVKLDGYGRYEADKSESILQTKRKKISSILTQWHSSLRLPNSTRFDRLFSSISPKKSKHLPPLDKEPSVIVN